MLEGNVPIGATIFRGSYNTILDQFYAPSIPLWEQAKGAAKGRKGK